MGLFFAVGASLAFLSPCLAQTGFRPRDAVAPPATLALPDRPSRTEARFQVIPIKLHANNETGPDWPGSDEIYVIFRDAQTQSGVRTPIFHGFDTGEDRNFAQAQGCVTPIGRTLAGQDGAPQAWECREGGVRGPLSFGVEIYEEDGNLTPESRSPYGRCTPPQGPAPQPSCQDDLVGRADFTFSLEVLLAELPTPGAEREYRRALGGYVFEYRVVRLNDVVVSGTFDRVN
jgi:hypothetical protein